MKRLLTPLFICAALGVPAVASAAPPVVGTAAYATQTPLVTGKGAVSIWTFSHHTSAKNCWVYNVIVYRRWPQGQKPGPWHAVLPIQQEATGAHAMTLNSLDLLKPYRWQFRAQQYADCRFSRDNILFAWHFYSRPPTF